MKKGLRTVIEESRQQKRRDARSYEKDFRDNFAKHVEDLKGQVIDAVKSAIARDEQGASIRVHGKLEREALEAAANDLQDADVTINIADVEGDYSAAMISWK